MCSVDTGLWCWDATKQAASDDAPTQRRGWRGVLSFSFEVGMRQGRVTLPCKSLPGVRAPNRFPRIFILRTAFPFHKIPKLFRHFIPSLNLSHVGNDLGLDNPLHLPFGISLDLFRASWGLFTVWSAQGPVRLQQRNVKHRMNFPPRRDF